MGWLTTPLAKMTIGQSLAVGAGTKAIDYVANKAGNRDAFKSRMEMGEKYGIHPLQMLGSAGNFSGQGGLNVGSQLMNSRENTRMASEQHDAHILKMQAEAAQATAYSRYLNAKALDPDDLDATDDNPSSENPHLTQEKIFNTVTGENPPPRS